VLLSTLRFGAFLSNYILLNSAPIYCGLWIFSKAFLSSSSFRTNPGVSAVGISDGVVYFDAGHFMCEFFLFIFQTKCCYPEIWVVCGSTPSDCSWSLDSGFVTYLAIFRSFLLLQCNNAPCNSWSVASSSFHVVEFNRYVCPIRSETFLLQTGDQLFVAT
jgi:hypothetical protein